MELARERVKDTETEGTANDDMAGGGNNGGGGGSGRNNDGISNGSGEGDGGGRSHWEPVAPVGRSGAGRTE